jgi:diaminobutyrate-2-oxoglutarate transaminase
MVSKSIESEVRLYSRSYPDVFVRSVGSRMYDAKGREYLDFLSGCGVLNYGHNHPELRSALIEYIERDGIAVGLDMHTKARQEFLDRFDNSILSPRDLQYRVQFTGPTGSNAVEAAIKLARKVTGRRLVISFTNAFHGCSLGALALTGSSHHRRGSEDLLTGVTRAFYDGYFGPNIDTAALLRKLLFDQSSGLGKPAAIIFETVQGDGGLNVATKAWAQEVASIAREMGALLIVDEIQIGCGRSDNFFSFETLGIRPDIVTMAKAISGYGLPMSLVLIRPECDAWAPGEHTGTFRGNNHAFVTAAKAIEVFWSDGAFEQSVKKKSVYLGRRLNEIATRFSLEVKGRGLMQGLSFTDGAIAERVKQTCYRDGLIVELCGPRDEIVKLLPPLTVTLEDLDQALDILTSAIDAAAS